jgi:subtilisin family serine protease
MWDGGSSYPNHGKDFYNNDLDPIDDNGHGSHVSGIIGASGNNGVGVTGVCWMTNIMALKSFNAAGDGSTSTIISAISFAIDHGANILNASFNLYGDADPPLSAAVTAAEQAGILIVSAAGNGCPDAIHCSPTITTGYNVDTSAIYPNTYPCAFPQDNILCVAAIDQKFQKASFSNYGSTSVDVAAPGTNVWSTWNTSNSAYALENGTSMATPYSVGLAALVWANNPTFTYLDVKNAVMYGGAAISSMSDITVSGNVINAYNALNYINVPRGLTAVVSQ